MCKEFNVNVTIYINLYKTQNVSYTVMNKIKNNFIFLTINVDDYDDDDDEEEELNFKVKNS